MLRFRHLAALGVTLLGSGCSSTLTEYHCTSSIDCVGDITGRCEASGHCSFLDDSCTSGFRFGDGAGSETDSCVGEGAQRPDARPSAGTDAGVGADAATAQLDWSAVTFGVPSLRPDLDIGANDRPDVCSPDGLTMLMDSDRTGGAGSLDIWSVTRTDLAAPFSNPTNLLVLNSPGTENLASWTGDGLEAVVTSNRDGPTSLYLATRSSTNDAFSAPALIPGVSSAVASEYGGSISSNGLELFFATSMGGPLNVYTANRAARNMPFGSPTLLAAMSSTASEFNTSPTPDGLGLFISSGRSGGAGGQDIWFSYRASVSDDFSAPFNVMALNSSSTESHATVCGAERRLYFSSNRSGQEEVYVSDLTFP